PRTETERRLPTSTATGSGTPAPTVAGDQRRPAPWESPEFGETADKERHNSSVPRHWAVVKIGGYVERWLGGRRKQAGGLKARLLWTALRPFADRARSLRGARG